MSEQVVSRSGAFSTESWQFLIAKMAAVMRPDDVVETFSELAVKKRDLIRFVLQVALSIQ